MKLIYRLALAVLFVAAVFAVHAQTSATTIILLRHAEKDTTGGKDPQLSAAGKARAEKLPTLFKDMKPDVFYATPFARTMQTLMPWAKIAGLQIKPYSPSDLPAFVNELKLLKGKTIVVAGHSNTTPMLVNMLLGSDKYGAMDDSDYSRIWVVTIDGGVVNEKIIKN